MSFTYAFDVEMATKYGVDEAIMIYNFQFWIMKNKANNNNFKDGRTWTYNSIPAWASLYPFWSVKQMRRILESLRKQGVILAEKYSKKSGDHTMWYAFLDESLFLPEFAPAQTGTLSSAQTGTLSSAQTGTSLYTDALPVPLPHTRETKVKPLTVKDKLFEEWYNAYDKKVSRASAEKLWSKLSSTEKESCLKVVTAYVASKPDKQYRNNPDKYLRNKCWNDEIVVRNTEKTSAATEYLSKIM